MKAEMLKALKEIGKEWHKDTMHRFYINLNAASDLYREHSSSFEWGDIPANRREKQNGKVWIDMETGEIMTKGIRCHEDMISCIRELIDFLYTEPAEETTENVESTESKEEPAMKYTVELSTYISGQGYSHTETIDGGSADAIFPASEWNYPDCPIEASERESYMLKISFYASGADPMFDDPIRVDTHWIALSDDD